MYSKVYTELLKKKRNCRDRDVRIKLELILLGLKLGNVSEACARRGFSRKFYHKWFGRLKRSGFELWALEDLSRRPHHSPRQIPKQLERDIRWYHRRQYGARMIKAMLLREGKRVCSSTICHVLNKRQKPSKKKSNKLKKHRKRYELVIPGQRIQLDVKYVPELINGKRMFAYVAVDECTRWRFVYVFSELNQHSTLVFLDKLKVNCPFPIHTIQTDNGFEFTFVLNPTTKTKAREHLMDEWCAKNAIRHRLIPPGEKELNGKVERSHRIDEQYFYWKAPTSSLNALNQAFAHWIKFYNHSRLHGGIGYITPIEKLRERFEGLNNEQVSADLELLKLRFLKETPKQFTKQDKTLLSLEIQLNRLLKAS